MQISHMTKQMLLCHVVLSRMVLLQKPTQQTQDTQDVLKNALQLKIGLVELETPNDLEFEEEKEENVEQKPENKAKKKHSFDIKQENRVI